ncbi:MAG TPA: 4Fe-4S dicluster domain-containing protein [Spirochaetota bacterium]
MYFHMSLSTIANLFKKPATLMHPFKKRACYEATRGHISIEFEKCIHCTICAKKCPTNAIKVDRANKVWEIEHLRCIACGSCVEACPKNCLTMEKDYRAPALKGEREQMHEVHKGA